MNNLEDDYNKIMEIAKNRILTATEIEEKLAAKEDNFSKFRQREIEKLLKLYIGELN